MDGGFLAQCLKVSFGRNIGNGQNRNRVAMAASQCKACLKLRLTRVGSAACVKASSVLYVQCGRWVYVRCAGMKMVTPKFSRNVACIKCDGNIGETVEHEEHFEGKQ